MTKVGQPRDRTFALAYVRVSTTEQADEGASLNAQRHLLAQEAGRRGWDVELIADEGYSAKSVEGRPGLTAALTRLDAGDADVLLVLRVDRLSRSVSDFAGLMARAQRRGWSLTALDLGVDTSTPAGDLMAHVLASVAQYERKVVSQRTREGMAQRRAEGVHVGRPSVLAMQTVQRIVVERSRGRTLTEIAGDLTSDQVPTARGGKWHPATIKGVLNSGAGQAVASRMTHAPELGTLRGATADHTWSVSRSATPDRFDAYVLSPRDGALRAEWVGYFESPDDAAQAAHQCAVTLDELPQ